MPENAITTQPSHIPSYQATTSNAPAVGQIGRLGHCCVKGAPPMNHYDKAVVGSVTCLGAAGIAGGVMIASSGAAKAYAGAMFFGGLGAVSTSLLGFIGLGTAAYVTSLCDDYRRARPNRWSETTPILTATSANSINDDSCAADSLK